MALPSSESGLIVAVITVPNHERLTGCVTRQMAEFRFRHETKEIQEGRSKTS